MPTIPDWWLGHQPVAYEPAAYRILRTVSVSASSWTEFLITSTDLADAADGRAQQSTNVEDAIIRSVCVLNNSGTAGEHVNISLFVESGNPNPTNAYNTAYVEGPSVELNCSKEIQQTKFWLKSDTGSPSVQLEIWYDIPAEE